MAEKKLVPQEDKKCANGDDFPVVLTTTGRGAFEEISLCAKCIPVSFRDLVDIKE